MTKEDKSAPRSGCNCAVCIWANNIIEWNRRLDEDLDANYQKYLNAALVSRDSRE